MEEIEDTSDIEGKMGDTQERWDWRRSGQASDPSCSAECVM